MTLHQLIAALATAAVVSAVPLVSQAALHRGEQVGSLIDRSELVFVGTLVEQRTEQGADGLPWTLHTFDVEEVLVGSAGRSQFSVRCAGGPTPKGYAQVSGTPVLIKGERALVLYNAEGGWCQFTGGERGVYPIRSLASADGANPDRPLLGTRARSQ